MRLYGGKKQFTIVCNWIGLENVKYLLIIEIQDKKRDFLKPMLTYVKRFVNTWITLNLNSHYCADIVLTKGVWPVQRLHFRQGTKSRWQAQARLHSLLPLFQQHHITVQQNTHMDLMNSIDQYLDTCSSHVANWHGPKPARAQRVCIIMQHTHMNVLVVRDNSQRPCYSELHAAHNIGLHENVMKNSGHVHGSTIASSPIRSTYNILFDCIVHRAVFVFVLSSCLLDARQKCVNRACRSISSDLVRMGTILNSIHYKIAQHYNNKVV